MKTVKVAKTTIQAMELISGFIDAVIKTTYADNEVQALIDITGSMVALPLAELKMFIKSIDEAMDVNPGGFFIKEIDEDDEDEKQEYYGKVSGSISIQDMIKMFMVTEDPSSYLKSKGIDDSFLTDEIRQRGRKNPIKRVPTEEEEINEMLDNILRKMDREGEE